jgi:hypothetical protein
MLCHVISNMADAPGVVASADINFRVAAAAPEKTNEQLSNEQL